MTVKFAHLNLYVSVSSVHIRQSYHGDIFWAMYVADSNDFNTILIWMWYN